MLGIGIIGAGRICGAHAAAAQALSETRLVSVSDVAPDRVGAAQERYGCRGHLDYREQLADLEIDAVVVGLPHWLHREVTIAALDAGKHVLLEKPMAMDVAECDAMIAAARSSGRTLMVGHSQHFFPVNLEAKRVLGSGAVGTVVMATDTWYKPFYDGERPAWFLDAAQGGGMWPMNGPHMIDRLMLFLESDVVSVQASVGNPILGLPATDMGLAFLRFANGVCAMIAHAGFRQGVNRFEMELTGTQAQLKIGGRQLWIGRDNAWEELRVPPIEVPTRPGCDASANAVFTAQMREFASAVLEARPPSVTAEYGRRVVQVLEGCEESSRTGAEVSLAETRA